MLSIVPANIFVVNDSTGACIDIQFYEEDCMVVLMILNGLELEKVPMAEIHSETVSVQFHGYNPIKMSFKTHDFSYSTLISAEQCEVIKCCCIDAYFKTYKDPHVDFSVGNTDICIGFKRGCKLEQTDL